MAILTREPAPGLIHHNDRGSQYTAYAFGRTLRISGILASMGRVGSAFDNAIAETFFATLKTELIDHPCWPTRHELETEVFSSLEGSYNSRRHHPRVGNPSPTDYEQQRVTQDKASA
ncbi:transposase [Kocuria sabuli]|uniref:transposase n=1 Tax=Kocuria sabuli TaxID=3071448 RepID=UPI0034D6B232